MKNNAAVDVAKTQAAGGGGEDDQRARYSEKWTPSPSSASSPRRSCGPCLERGTPPSSSSSSHSPPPCSVL
ncbi:unnamed protein product [Ectocarpus fasciculatus]